MFEIELNDAEELELQEGDYIKDGLIYCGKCNTPKQREIKLNGKMHKINIYCECQEKIESELAEKKAAIRQAEEHKQFTSRLRQACFSDERMHNWTFANSDKADARLENIATKYVEHFEEMRKMGKGLLLCGSTGTGKSYMAACIANALIDKEYCCTMTDFPRISNDLWNTDDKQKYIKSLCKADLLIIDDLYTERESDYMNEIVYSVIDTRYRMELPLIITTNMQAKDLQLSRNMRRDRINSRLMEMCLPVVSNGKDRRAEARVKTYSEIEKVLGI